jgi:hypothetical protein
MKRIFQISFVLLLLFLLSNGNGFLYAHTNQVDKTISLTISLEKAVHSYNQNIEVNTEFDNQVVISTLQSDPFPTRKKKSKRFKFPFFEKEEKEKEDKSASFEQSLKHSFSFESLLDIPLFARFYNYDRDYLHISESLNYFLFYKCYILFQVFRL